ncbi:accessory Sec system protein translocase subunit SecY2 [Leuconostoc pseudomesenteroides]|nr:accessory Sec system protein translocase subunit SecY2 [Leuconostoc pseudomesenteroides]
MKVFIDNKKRDWNEVVTINVESKIIKRKILTTGTIIFVYVLGRHILIPGVDVKQILSVGDNQSLFKFVSGMTGGDLSTLSFFSLGLGPWMSTLILWRVFGLIKKFELDKLTLKKSYILKIILSSIIAGIQAIAISSTVSVRSNFLFIGNNPLITNIMLAFIMVTGAIFLIWLSNMNEAFGIGGPIVLILAGIVIKVPDYVVTYLGDMSQEHLNITDIVQCIVFIIAFIFLVRIAIIMQESELRLPIRNTLGNGDFVSKSYLPIQVNPAGGMPLMYSMTVTVLPQYGLQLIHSFYPHNYYVTYLMNNSSLSQPMGVTAYIIILTMLTMGFSFVNVDPEKICTDLLHSGDYIENMEPGEATRQYLTTKIYHLGIVGALYLDVISGIPLYIGTINSDFTQYGLAAGTVIILVSLSSNIYDQIHALLIKNDYPKLIE